jgi:hypothetical protein
LNFQEIERLGLELAEFLPNLFGKMKLSQISFDLALNHFSRHKKKIGSHHVLFVSLGCFLT